MVTRITKIVLSLLLLTWSYGCSYTSREPAIYIEPKGYYSKSHQYRDWRDANTERLSVYIGKTKEEVIRGFGEPTDIKDKPKLKGEYFDEQWVYFYTRGIPMIYENTWMCNFYFNGDVVVEVRAM